MREQSVVGAYEKTSGKTMSGGEILKAEIRLIKDSPQGGVEKEIKTNESPVAQVSRYHNSMSFGGRSENTPKHSGAASMETTDNKHQGLSERRGHDSSGRVEVSSGFSPNKPPGLDRTTSPAWSAHVFPTPASSRESILSEGWDRDKCWPAMPLSSVASPSSLSRTVSPCSSVRSGVFSPAVVQIRKHALAPGSSLVHIPQSCFSSCDSLASSIHPQSPPVRRRLPLTRLSLLTAILRKGRLPVLSASLPRPYTPCWPVNPVTLTFCNACSAASTVASIPLEFSSPFTSSTTLDGQAFPHREPIRSVTAPPPELPDEHSRPRAPVKWCSRESRPRSLPKWDQAISSPQMESRTVLPRDPSPGLCSKFKGVAPNDIEIPRQPTFAFKPPELKPSFAHLYLSSKRDHNFDKDMTPPTLLCQAATSTTEKSPQPNSSLSKLRWLSERLRSPSPSSPLSSQSHSRSASTATSPLPSFTTGRCKSPQGFPKAHNLTSRDTPVAFSGWHSPIGSPTPTPSPATLFRDFTPSPSFSPRFTPSPRPGSGISDCSDRESKKRKPHKIKSSYKSLAAIPTNTVLLDQQVIDEQVERENVLKRGIMRDEEDTHAEMCSPAQLRQQSEELYAAIDEILANSNPPNKTATKMLATDVSLRSNSTKSLGRETKYASVSSVHPLPSVKRRLTDSKKTKPGIVHPMMTVPKLSEKDGAEYRGYLFRETDARRSLKGNAKTESVGLEDTGGNGHTSRTSQALQGQRTSERRGPYAMWELQIIEPEGQISHDASTSLCSQPCETHI
ncbi:muscular LMNA-interacting protein isoform X2 [Hippocampus zosterae]|uniref:muscular LMNA-interacting protein isoform X2 n=1 Tax=Hippocampus zosterae TaxID=109293 RepID=UPI00223E55C6|nr:muscular LMNA-interacting protein isoform X2 [Hippocampus zosterae]